MAKDSAAANALYAPICQRLIESGEWDRISARLGRELSESGWADDLRGRTKETARSGEAVTVDALVRALSSQAADGVPVKVKQEILGLIKRQVERQLE